MLDLNQKPFIVAEIGGNHEGSFKRAKKLLKLAAKTGVDAVKFQIYQGDNLVSPIEDPERNLHFKKFELEEKEWMELIEMAQNLKTMFMASVWDLETLEKFDPYLSLYKIGSGDLTCWPILEKIAKKGKPIFLSTAMANLKEIRETVDFLKKINPRLIEEKKLVLLHCVAMYGEPKDEYANLLSIKVLQEKFPNLYIGYSDHTKGIFACQVALAMGAKVIEKHFTDDKTRKFRDHQISATFEEMKELVDFAKRIQILLGKYKKEPILPIENEKRIQEFRRGMYAKKDLTEGTILTPENLIALRPNLGIDAKDFYKILGKKLKISKKKFEKINYEELE